MLITWRLSAAELRALPFSDFFERAEAAMRDRRREAEAGMRCAAFSAWLRGAGGDRPWGDFERMCGLSGPDGAETGEGVKDTAELKKWAQGVVEKIKT
ncbi:hypothetical protein R80B4_00971 [Fibrobacteres bacterium R8-0-B4]